MRERPVTRKNVARSLHKLVKSHPVVRRYLSASTPINTGSRFPSSPRNCRKFSSLPGNSARKHFGNCDPRMYPAKMPRCVRYNFWITYRTSRWHDWFWKFNIRLMAREVRCGLYRAGTGLIVETIWKNQHSSRLNFRILPPSSSFSSLSLLLHSFSHFFCCFFSANSFLV